MKLLCDGLGLTCYAVLEMTIELLFWVHGRIRRLPDHDKIKIKAVSEYAIRRGFKCVPVAFKCICLEHHHKAVTTGSLCRCKVESPAFLRVAGQHQRDGKKASDAVFQPAWLCLLVRCSIKELHNRRAAPTCPHLE